MSRWRRSSESVGMEWGSKLEMGFSRWEADCGGGAALETFVLERNRLWWGEGMWAEARQRGKVRLGSS
jgi:hypothetical protein